MLGMYCSSLTHSHAAAAADAYIPPAETQNTFSYFPPHNTLHTTSPSNQVEELTQGPAKHPHHYKQAVVVYLLCDAAPGL